MEMNLELKENRKKLISFIRKNTSCKYAGVYGFGSYYYKEKALLPLWYSDTLKLCYPADYYSEEEVKKILKKIQVFMRKEKIDEKLRVYMEPHYIGGLHADGWKIKFDEI